MSDVLALAHTSSIVACACKQCRPGQHEIKGHVQPSVKAMWFSPSSTTSLELKMSNWCIALCPIGWDTATPPPETPVYFMKCITPCFPHLPPTYTCTARHARPSGRREWPLSSSHGACMHAYRGYTQKQRYLPTQPYAMSRKTSLVSPLHLSQKRTAGLVAVMEGIQGKVETLPAKPDSAMPPPCCAGAAVPVAI